jgi:hypothetical protein
MGNQGSLDNTPYYAYQIIAQASRSVSSRSVAEEALKCLLRVVLPFHVFNSFEVTCELRLASSICTFQRTHQPS